jgi:hypothetical protein
VCVAANAEFRCEGGGRATAASGNASLRQFTHASLTML